MSVSSPEITGTSAPPRVWSELFADMADFSALDWGRSSRRFRAADFVRSLVSRDLVEHWLAFGNLRYPQFNVAYGGKAAPPTSFTRTITRGVHQQTGCAVPEKIAAHIRGGATLTLSNPEQWHQPATRFCHDLAVATRARAELFVYITAPGQYGSKPHRDDGEIFIVQLEGSKRWSLYDIPTDDRWGMGMIGGDPEPSDTFVLNPGDALYVPTGLGHRAEALSEGSVHLTISVRTARLHEIVTSWANGVASALPRNARMAATTSERRQQLRELFEMLEKQAANADIDAVLDTLVETDRLPHRQPLRLW